MTITIADADYLLAAGQTLSLTSQSGVTYQGVAASPHSITIAGDLTINSFPQPSGTPLLINGELDGVASQFSGDFGSARVLVAATGTVSLDVTGSAHTADGIFDDSGPEVVNQGVISVKADASAIGVLAGSETGFSGEVLNNSGTIEATSTTASATGVSIIGAGSDENSGHIEASGFISAIGLHVFSQFGFTNSGTIEAQTAPSGLPSVGVELDVEQVSFSASFTNSGTIQADIALETLSKGGFGFDPVTVDTIQNTGHIIGAMNLETLRIVLDNAGSIMGAVNLSAFNDVYDGRLGTETGLLQGGTGDDTLMGGAGSDNLQGNQGNDSVSGGAGDDIVVGGKDDDIQAGGDGNDVVWGNLGNDTLDGGNGADQVRGGQGDDSVSGGAGDDYVSGDRGSDTISGGAGADLFHGSQDAGIDRVLDFSQAEGDRVELDPGTTYTLSQVGADTVIDMGPISGAPNQMILVGVQLSTLTGNWIFEG